MKIIATYEEKDGRQILVWPDSAMILTRKPLFIPEDAAVAVPAIGARITAVGKSIKKRFAERYYEALAPMVFILNHRSSELLAAGDSPLGCDIVSDCSVVCGDFIEATECNKACELNLKYMPLLSEDTEHEILTETKVVDSPIEKIGEAIETASVRNTVKTGDLVAFLCKETIPARRDYILKIEINNKLLLETKFK